MKVIIYILLNIIIQFSYSLSFLRFIKALEKGKSVPCSINKSADKSMYDCRLTIKDSLTHVLRLSYKSKFKDDHFVDFRYHADTNDSSLQIIEQDSSMVVKEVIAGHDCIKKINNVFSNNKNIVILEGRNNLSLFLPYVQIINNNLYLSIAISDSIIFKESQELQDIAKDELYPNSVHYNMKSFLRGVSKIHIPTIDNIEQIREIYESIIKKEILFCDEDGCLENSMYVIQKIKTYKKIEPPLLVQINPATHKLLGDIWRHHYTLIYKVKEDNEIYVVDQDYKKNKKIPTVRDFLLKLDPTLSGSIDLFPIEYKRK